GNPGRGYFLCVGVSTLRAGDAERAPRRSAFREPQGELTDSGHAEPRQALSRGSSKHDRTRSTVASYFPWPSLSSSSAWSSAMASKSRGRPGVLASSSKLGGKPLQFHELEEPFLDRQLEILAKQS